MFPDAFNNFFQHEYKSFFYNNKTEVQLIKLSQLE